MLLATSRRYEAPHCPCPNPVPAAPPPAPDVPAASPRHMRPASPRHDSHRARAPRLQIAEPPLSPPSHLPAANSPRYNPGAERRNLLLPKLAKVSSPPPTPPAKIPHPRPPFFDYLHPKLRLELPYPSSPSLPSLFPPPEPPAHSSPPH
ncbi:hypothetical protein BS78_10G135100 [Paspalum vaginatum]|nr:hypothetical protein BS78_10G135100 [Paspalum vaginatum]